MHPFFMAGHYEAPAKYHPVIYQILIKWPLLQNSLAFKPVNL
jgi:hypothetical protein